jgi:hypothetical protein
MFSTSDLANRHPKALILFPLEQHIRSPLRHGTKCVTGMWSLLGYYKPNGGRYSPFAPAVTACFLECALLPRLDVPVCVYSSGYSPLYLTLLQSAAFYEPCKLNFRNVCSLTTAS